MKIKENNITITHPDIVKEWDYEKNGELLPEYFTCGSREKIYWVCENGHGFSQKINNRAIGKNGCPYCSGHRVLEGFNDLATTHPEIAKQWHPTMNGELKPEKVATYSGRDAWWLGECGHEWKTKISTRTTQKSNCPYCCNKKILIGFNDLATTHPDLAKEWHPTKNGELKPTDVSAGSNKKVWWICEKNHSFYTKIIYRTLNKTACPYCAHRKLLIGYNDFETLYPKIVKEWHPTKNGDLKPSDVIAGSDRKVWWQCKKGHEWQTRIINRCIGHNCPECTLEYKSSFPEFAILYFIKQNAFDTIHRYNDLGFEIDIFIPSLKIGIEYDGEYWHKTKNKNDLEKNSLCKQNNIKLYRIREKLSSLNDYSIDFISNGTEKELSLAIQFLLKEIFNIEKEVDIKNYTFEIRELMEFSYKEISFAKKFPDLVKEWHYAKNGKLKPELVSPYSGKKVWWLGTCGHEWQARVSDRSKGGGCPHCNAGRLLKNYNDLETKNPQLAKEWHPTKNGDLRPNDVTCGNDKKSWWICEKCNHEWQATIKDRHKKKSGCPKCAGHSKVKNKETGEIFKSLSEAARTYGIKYPHCIAIACNNNKTSGGFHWEYVE